MKKLLSTLAMACLLCAAHASIAAPIGGDGTVGDFYGDFSYFVSNDSPDKAQVVMKLTNTSDPSNGGYLTAFAFNLPSVEGVSVSNISLITDDGSAFSLIGEASGKKHGKHNQSTDFDNTIMAAPFGFYDVGASIARAKHPQPLLGGGSPTSGIQPGDTEHFIFLLYGENLDLLTLDDFFNEMPGCKHTCPKATPFLITRFKGFDNGCSDKLPGSPVPVPATVWLLGAGLIGLFSMKKKG